MQEVYGTHWVNTKNTAVAMGYFDGIHIGHQFLINQMEEYAEKNNISIKSINKIFIVVGPGSFTGIRIGIASVKAMAEVSNKKIIYSNISLRFTKKCIF